uniref:Uncharacterized protein n=1 Tax=viral metagenome TaxID=1070528 RepID=A0A6M3J0N5_9ZZZZ
MANFKITYAELYTRISEFLNLTASETAPTGTNLTRCKTLAERGLRRFLYPIDQESGRPHEWSFLRPFYTLNTLSGKWKYQLPEDFSSIITDPTYGDDESFSQMVKTAPDIILNLRSAGVTNYAPFYYCIIDSSFDPAIGEFSEIWLYPEPDSSYPIQFFYKADPTKPSNAADYLPGGVKATEAIIESCLAVCEQNDDNMNTKHHTALADKLVQELIIIDKQRESELILGNLYSDNQRVFYERDQHDLTVYDSDLT